MRLAYRAAGLDPPARIVWCEGPIALSNLALRASGADGVNVKSVILQRPHRQAAAAVGKRLHRRVKIEVEGKVSPADPLVEQAAELVIQGAAQEDGPLLDRLRRARPLTWSYVLHALLGSQGFRSEAIGQHELAWLGAYDYYRDALGLVAETAPLQGLFQLAQSLGWLQPHARTCWLAERPDRLRGDDRGRLHDDSAPALRFRDGWSVWAWKGVVVPSWLILHPDRITLAMIDHEQNVQIRRCMIEIMTPERYVAQGGAVRVAEDETGVLWRKTWLSADTWAAVEVINATPEPDGTHRHFFLQVPAHMRTAREAVAWTYGLTASAYKQLVVRT
ncbi:MAG: hypothetical protein JOZ34_06230 [Gammaproteobacteria bacterium]|nr:hypothetical protein [Gammaproteobacteria bacterium]